MAAHFRPEGPLSGLKGHKSGMRVSLLGLVGALTCPKGAESTLHERYEKVHSWKRGPIPGPERAHPRSEGGRHRFERAHYMHERAHFIPGRTHPRSKRVH